MIRTQCIGSTTRDPSGAIILASANVGRYLVQVYDYPDLMRTGKVEPVYRVLLDGRRVKCFTRSDERTFPKRAAKAGQMMVDAIVAARAA